MATFDEDVLVNGTLRVSRTGSGAVLVGLDSERAWELRQAGSGAGAAMELANVGGGGNKNLIITTTGRVGIGTASPEDTLHVAGPVRAAGFVSVDGMLSARRVGDGAVLLNLASERRWQFRQLDTGQSAKLELASVEQTGTPAQISNKDFVINTRGRVGIGTTSPTHTLDVEGNIGAQDVILASDVRLKTGIRPIDGAARKLEKLRGVEFEWRALGQRSARRSAGVVAQEVESVAPELVHSEQDGAYKSVKVGALLGTLVEAFKELAAENRALKRRVEALERTRVDASPHSRSLNTLEPAARD
jgi:Chaperone of endosialidase